MKTQSLRQIPPHVQYTETYILHYILKQSVHLNEVPVFQRFGILLCIFIIIHIIHWYPSIQSSASSLDALVGYTSFDVLFIVLKISSLSKYRFALLNFHVYPIIPHSPKTYTLMMQVWYLHSITTQRVSYMKIRY